MRERISRWRAHRISFRDLGFKTEPLLCHTSNGRPVWSVEYVGVPHIEPELSDSVAYLLGVNPRTGRKEIGGTGFIVSRSSVVLGGLEHYYMVTNSHVFADTPEIQVNTLDGGSALIAADQLDWHVRPSFDDIAVLDVTDRLDFSVHAISPFPEAEFLVEKQTYFGMGDDVFMIGLFEKEPGTGRNFPKARFGNISGLADQGEPIEQPNKVKRPTHIVDMRSRTGYSGSPVFVYDAPHHVWTDDRWTLRWSGTGLLKLLGVHCGQYPDRVRATEFRGNIPTGRRSQWEIPASMNLVVPAWRISELLDDQVLENARLSRDERRRDEHCRRARPEDHAF